MFSKNTRSNSKSKNPVTTSKGSSPAKTRDDKPVATQPKAVVTPAAPVVVAAKPPVVATAVVVATAAPKTEVARDRTAIIALIAKLQDHDADTARDAATTLGTLTSDAEAVTALISVVQNRDAYYHCVVRAAAAETLGKLGDRRAVDALIEATRDTMAETSHQAINALGLLGDPRALPALEATVSNEHGFFLENIRNAATDAIASINKKLSRE